MTITESILIQAALTTGLMATAFFAWTRGARVAWVDIAWSFAVGVNAIALILVHGAAPFRNLVCCLCIGAWSLRLGWTLLVRVREHDEEDGRYKRMLGAFGDRPHLRLAIFYLGQALVALLFALPPLLAARSPLPLGIWDAWALVVAAIAIGGETVSDRQLAAFRRAPNNRGQVCRRGWWAYSRHPNYFFEWIHWFAYLPLAWYAPQGWLAIGGPLLMYLLLNRVSGIPFTEQQARASRGAAYADYQRTVSRFFLWPPRRTES